VIDIREVTPGKSYGCRFRVYLLVGDDDSIPEVASEPSEDTEVYENIGYLKQRDLEQELVVVIDSTNGLEFVVPFKDIWDVDDIEIVDDTE